MRLRTRFAVALLVAAIVLSVTSLVGFTLYRDAIVDQEHEDLTRASEGIATQLDLVFAEKQEVTRLWATHSDLREHGSPRQNETLEAFVRSTSFSGASVVAANGTMTGLSSESLTRSEETDLVGQYFGYRQYVHRALGGDTFVSEPIDAESGNRIVTVSTPLYEDGEAVGTLNAVFHVDEDALGPLLRTNLTESRGIRVFADDVTLYSAGSTGASTATNGALVANATVDETGWGVSVTETRAAFESRLWTITLMQAGAFLLVLVSLAVFGGWLYREYVGNFRRLHGGFASLVDGDYGATVALSGATEWEEVESHFNELSETLAQRRTEVIVLNRVLRHNLRNAMTVVVGNADRIAHRTDDERSVEEAHRISRRAESLLDRADHARAIEQSLHEPIEETAARSVGDVLEEVTSIITDEFPEATLSVTANPPDATVRGTDLLVVALDELVRNAIVHGDDQSPVSVEATADDDRVRIAVSDDGPGLPAIERRVLAEPFVETATEHGSGLGLWLVNWLVRWAGGDIDVSVDDGTTVTVTVPRANDGGADVETSEGWPNDGWPSDDWPEAGLPETGEPDDGLTVEDEPDDGLTVEDEPDHDGRDADGLDDDGLDDEESIADERDDGPD